MWVFPTTHGVDFPSTLTNSFVDRISLIIIS